MTYLFHVDPSAGSLKLSTGRWASGTIIQAQAKALIAARSKPGHVLFAAIPNGGKRGRVRRRRPRRRAFSRA